MANSALNLGVLLLLLGEPPVCGVPAAIANAIAAASGARMHELPMSPMRVWSELHGA